MGTPNITDYITPAPPYVAGGDRLSQTISEIWKKRQVEEQLKLNQQQLAEESKYHQGSLDLGHAELGETTRSHKATEGHNQSQLEATKQQRQMEFIDKTAQAYASGNVGLGDALAANAGLFGLTPQAMAALVQAAPPEGAAAGGAAAPAGAADDGMNYDFGEPGDAESPEPAGAPPAVAAPAPQTFNGGRRGGGGQPLQTTAGQVPRLSEVPAQGYAAPVAPQGDPLPAAVPPQAQGPFAPGFGPGPAPAPPPAAAPPQAAAPAAPPQAPEGGVRREDIFIQPKPPSQLGVPGPAYDPTQSTTLPGTPTDPRMHPTALEANPNWQQAPTTFPGAPSAPGAGQSPQAAVGPPGGAPGNVDPAMQRQFFNRGVMPNGAQIVGGNARRIRGALQPAMTLAKDADEIVMIESAIEQGVAMAQAMPADEVVKHVNGIIQQQLRSKRSDEAAGERAEVIAQRYGRAQDRADARDWLTIQRKLISEKGASKDVANYEALQRFREVLSDFRNPIAWETAKGLWLRIMENKGSSTEGDIGRAGGESSTSILGLIENQIARWGTGGTSEGNYANMMNVVSKLDELMLRRTLDEYKFARAQLREAPNDYAYKYGEQYLEGVYSRMPWAEAAYARDRKQGGRHAAPAAPAARKGPAAPEPKASAPKARPPQRRAKAPVNLDDLGIETFRDDDEGGVE